MSGAIPAEGGMPGEEEDYGDEEGSAYIAGGNPFAALA